MKTLASHYGLAACLLLSLPGIAHSADPIEAPKELKQLLQEGLFEEEAAHDLDKAAAAYSALIAKFDGQRTLAATAIFRLAEVRSKQGKKDEAAALWQRIATEFPNHDPLAKLSRERLAGLGLALAPSNQDTTSDEEAKELSRLREIAKNSPDLLFARPDGWTPLDNAAARGSLRAADFLLSQGVKIEDAPSDHSALTVAAAAGHKTMVDFLLDHGADINALGRFVGGIGTPLAAAVTNQRETVFKDLLARGADVNRPDKDGKPPLLLACEIGSLEMCRELLAKGANPNAFQPFKTEPQNRDSSWSNDKPTQQTVLWSAVKKCISEDRTDLLEFLLAHGATPVAPGGDLATEVEFALAKGHEKSLTLLLSKMPKLTDARVLEFALYTYAPDILRLVLAHHTNINTPQKQMPLLMLATDVANWIEALPILLEAGASVKDTDSGGRTVLHSLAKWSLTPHVPPSPIGKPRNEPRRRIVNDTAQIPRPQLNQPAINSTLAFPYADVPKDLPPATVDANKEWEVRRPLFEALLAKGADINAADHEGRTPLFHLLWGNPYATEAAVWFVSKGANILKAGSLEPNTPPFAPLRFAVFEVRVELARRLLFPKIAKPDAILFWGEAQSLDKPFEHLRKTEGAAPPALAELVAEAIPKPAPAPAPRTGMARIVRPPATRPLSILIVVNRKGPDGQWREQAVLRQLLDQPVPTYALEWGDLVFVSSTSQQPLPPPSEEAAPR